MLGEWNLPTGIVATFANHHRPRTVMEKALSAAMSAPFDDSAARCLDMPFKAAMRRLDLADHVDFVETEARLFADATAQVFAAMADEVDIAP